MVNEKEGFASRFFLSKAWDFRSWSAGDEQQTAGDHLRLRRNSRCRYCGFLLLPAPEILLYFNPNDRTRPRAKFADIRTTAAGAMGFGEPPLPLRPHEGARPSDLSAEHLHGTRSSFSTPLRSWSGSVWVTSRGAIGIHYPLPRFITNGLVPGSITGGSLYLNFLLPRWRRPAPRSQAADELMSSVDGGG